MKELKTRNFESHLHKFNEMNDTVLVIDGNTMNITYYLKIKNYFLI